MKKPSVEGVLSPKHHGNRARTNKVHPTPVKRTRASRDETTIRILDAAEDLFSRRDPAKVTVREIAEAAGVTHPLVHQYVGSKADIQDAVIKRGAPRRGQMIAEHQDLREIVPLLAADVVDKRMHSHAIVRSAMDGVEYAPLEDRIANGQAMLRIVADSIAQGRVRTPPAGAIDPRVVLAATTALLYGWVATEDWLAQMYSLDDSEMAEARRQMGEIAALVADMALPLTDASSGNEL